MNKILVVSALLYGVIADEWILSHDGKRHVKPTPCEVQECPHGGCLFQDCDKPVTCKGGLCDFINCKKPDCSGGVCTIVTSLDATCDGGLCDFVKAQNSLTDSHCKGGLCKVDGKEYTTSVSSSLNNPPSPPNNPTPSVATPNPPSTGVESTTPTPVVEQNPSSQ